MERAGNIFLYFLVLWWSIQWFLSVHFFSAFYLLPPVPCSTGIWTLLSVAAQALLLWSTCCDSAIFLPVCFCLPGTWAHWVLLSPDGQLPFSLPEVTLLWSWSPFHLLCLHPHLSGSPSLEANYLLVILSSPALRTQFSPLVSALLSFSCGSYCGEWFGLTHLYHKVIGDSLWNDFVDDVILGFGFTILFDFVYEGIWGNYKTVLSSLLSYLSFCPFSQSKVHPLFCVLEKKNPSSYLKIYFWMWWVFVVVCRLSLVALSRGYSFLWCVGFSL